jgi:hypothetical protein
MTKHLTRFGPLVWGPTGKIPVGRSKFYTDYVATGRVTLVPLGERAKAVIDEQIDTVVEEIIAAAGNTPRSPPPPNLLKKRAAAS